MNKQVSYLDEGRCVGLLDGTNEGTDVGLEYRAE